jgi:hypothetical protein
MEEPFRVEIQDRDITFLLGLFESRIMTLRQAAALYFDGQNESAKKRIQKLKKAGFIAVRSRRVSEPAILSLTTSAFSYLRKNQLLTGYPKLSLSALEGRGQVSDLTIQHELQVMDVKGALAAALRENGRYTLTEFLTWPRLCEFFANRPDPKFGNTKVLVKPDGFIRIAEHESGGGVLEYTFFLEVDRSTETLETLALRAACYADYFRSGGLAIRNGQPKEAYKDFPFRLLIVCKTAERRNNTTERLLQLRPPILTLAWLTTIQEITKNALGKIWIRPADYQCGTRGASYGDGKLYANSIYRRQTERDAFIALKISKLTIFD